MKAPPWRWRSCFGAENAWAMRDREWDPSDELLQAGASGHRKQRAGRLVDKGEGLRGMNTGYGGMSSKREDSWHRKVCGTSPEREREDVAGQRCIAQGRRRPCERVQGHA